MKITIDIKCGEKTCAVVSGNETVKACAYFGTRKFGQIPVCTLFPSKEGTYTDLRRVLIQI